jgi:p-hydroxybenzoate 3-monooxygenase
VAADLATRVGIVGGGPAGLLLSHMLHRLGIESIVVEARSRDHCERRVRAGVLEHGTVQVLTASGVGERLGREGLVHHGIDLRFGGADHRIAFERLVPGRAITVYGQQEVVKDLIAARLAAGGALLFDAPAVAVEDIDSDRPSIVFTHGGEQRRVRCDVVVGCDGFHGVARSAIPAAAQDLFTRDFPFAWLGVLAAVAPSARELIYAQHDRGFALHSMRSPSVSRFYLQVGVDEDLTAWPDDRIWAELATRLETVPGWQLARGPVLEKGITGMRSYVVEPMRYGRLFLAGDAAHIVPPTGAKGLNLAASDVRYLFDALHEFYTEKSSAGLDAYSARALDRIWKAERFSWWMTTMLHTFAEDDAFGRRIHDAELAYTLSSAAARTALAENYVGLPY